MWKAVLSTNSLLVVSTIAFQVIRKKKSFLPKQQLVSFFFLCAVPTRKQISLRAVHDEQMQFLLPTSLAY